MRGHWAPKRRPLHNGLRLQRLAGQLAAAGLDRVNVSLDSLVRDRYRQITWRDCLDRALAGLEELEKHPSLSPIKVNVASIRSFTEDEILDFARLARHKPGAACPESEAEDRRVRRRQPLWKRVA